MTSAAFRRHLRRLLSHNLTQFGGLHERQVLGIDVGQLRRQNRQSSRIGGRATIRLVTANSTDKVLWVKCVRDPQQAFRRMRAAFDAAVERGVESPIPEPYLFDTELNVIILEYRSGLSLQRAVLGHCLHAPWIKVDFFVDLFRRIGSWLASYHNATSRGRSITIREVITNTVANVEAHNKALPPLDRTIIGHLQKLQSTPAADVVLPLAQPHNDFTLRNIYYERDGRFQVLDWDASAHPLFDAEAPGPWDATLFLLNIESLTRFAPLLDFRKISELCGAFQRGYFESLALSNSDKITHIEDILMYIFSARYWFGVGTDRRLSQVYHRRLAWRYSRSVAVRLAKGPALPC